MMRRHRSLLLLAPLAAWAGLAGCKIDEPPSFGECTVDMALNCDGAGLAGSVDAGVPLGLVGFSCTGAMRPDLQYAKYIAGIPHGMICADQVPGPDGAARYCCTPPDKPTTCAIDATSIQAISNNPTRTCSEPGNVRFQCYGTDRPEALNPALTCGNGVREDNLIDFCCAGAGRPNGCTEAKGFCVDSMNRANGLVGWHCPGGTRPRGEDFGANESRADYFYFVCGVPTPAGDGSDSFCCFTPSPLLPGGSCVTMAKLDKIQAELPTCTTNRFAFACYGRETPEDDYLPIHCEEAAVQGTDDYGYPATLYCCDYRKPNGGSCTKGDECLSGDCTEGYCCALATCPSCYSCAISGVPGTCRLVPPGGTDPTGQCAACNGTGGCQ